ncbi:MAG: DNA polymerase III subunit delta [Bacteroidota bacterium]|nr:DNA polymerase III subunit delta [Bacteroidota bacterium]
MATHTFESIIKDLKNKVYHPVYFFHGDEPYFIDQLSGYIESHVLTDMEKEFNQSVLYGRDIDPVSIFSSAKRYPMMSNYQVIIIREAQDVKNLFKKKLSDDSQGDESDNLDPLYQYLLHPQKSTILVFCYKYKKLDKRTKIVKLLEKTSVVLESKKLYDDKIPAWINSYVKGKGFKIGEKASGLLAEYLGTDLSKVSNELDKLMIGLKAGGEINSAAIESNIGISKDFNVFELQNAISAKDFQKVNRIINYFGSNPKSNPFVLTLSTLNGYFNKIISYHVFKGKPGVNLATALGVNPYFMRDFDKAARSYSLKDAMHAISLLHEYDLRSKGVNNLSTTENELLKELVYKIMHPGVLHV